MNVGLHFYLLEIKKILSYRAEFWLGFIGNVASQFGVAYFLWKAIFLARGLTSLQGFDFGALMLYYLLVPLVERAVNGQELGNVSGEIYEGGLTRYLLYPVSFFRIKYLGQLAQSTVFLVQLFVAMALFMLIFRTPHAIGIFSILKTIPVIFCAGILHFIMTINLEIIAFWADNVWSLTVLNRLITHLLGGGLLPLAFFPDRVQSWLGYLPYSRLVSFPINCLLGHVGNREWLIGLTVTAAWSLGLGLVAAWTWSRGLKTYTGVGI